MEPREFTVHVEEAVLKDLRQRLGATRDLPAFNERGKDYGQGRVLQESLLAHWRDAYDWRAHERELNKFKQFKANVLGLDVHFIHERSKVPGAVPILLVHGWPGSVWEFHNAIPQLVSPTGRALRLKQAFHVVCPSLPGYGWSQAATEPGMDVAKIARMFKDLMVRLGYDRFVVQGGDWGAVIGKFLAHDFPNHCVALHTNMPIPLVGGTDLKSLALLAQMALDLSPLARFTLTPRDREHVANTKQYAAHGSSYFHQHATEPHTLGFALADSPAGLLAWITSKIQLWTDGSGNVFNALSKDEIITNVMIYWVTNTLASSSRLYYETARMRARLGFVEVPTGVASFPKEIIAFPRRWIAHSYNIVHYTVFNEGGHFAAWEQPDAFVQDVRTFSFRSMPFEKACRLADERVLRRQQNASETTSVDLATSLLYLAPALPVPAVAAVATYLLYSKL